MSVSEKDIERAKEVATYLSCDCDYGMSAEDREYFEKYLAPKFAAHRVEATAELSAELERLRQEASDRNERVAEARRERDAAHRDLIEAKSTRADVDRLVEWMIDPEVREPHVAFTRGPDRVLADHVFAHMRCVQRLEKELDSANAAVGAMRSVVACEVERLRVKCGNGSATRGDIDRLVVLDAVLSQSGNDAK